MVATFEAVSRSCFAQNVALAWSATAAVTGLRPICSSTSQPPGKPMADNKEHGEQIPLTDEQLNELVRHLEAEERDAQEATLSSLESFNLWIMTHPALRQMAIVDSVAQLTPAILTVLRRLLGI